VVHEAFDDETAGDLAHDISVALMLVLERLSPLERASFLLDDVFGLDFAEVSRARPQQSEPLSFGVVPGARADRITRSAGTAACFLRTVSALRRPLSGAKLFSQNILR
jgi:hypothetical protein